MSKSEMGLPDSIVVMRSVAHPFFSGRKDLSHST